MWFCDGLLANESSRNALRVGSRKEGDDGRIGRRLIEQNRGRMGLGVEIGGEGSKMGSIKVRVEHMLRVSIIVTLTLELRVK